MGSPGRTGITLLPVRSEAIHWTRNRPVKAAWAASPRMAQASRFVTILPHMSSLPLPALVPERSLLHPSNGHHVPQRLECPVEHAVLGPARDAGPMIDGDFDHAIALHLHEGRQEAMHAVEQLESIDALAAEYLQAAGRIVNLLSRQPVAQAVGDASGDEPNPGVPAV